MRFRIRPPRNREKALTIKCIMKIAGSKVCFQFSQKHVLVLSIRFQVEIRMEAMAASQIERSKGGKATRRQIPCEDIAIKYVLCSFWAKLFLIFVFQNTYSGFQSPRLGFISSAKNATGASDLFIRRK